MQITDGPLSGLKIIEPRLFRDDRGYFFEAYHHCKYDVHAIPPMVQDNISISKKNVVRALHYQKPQAQGKLVYVLKGAVWDVAVDLRVSSPTFKKWYAIELTSDNHLQMYIPPGFAHGFCTLSDEVIFGYKCTNFYAPADEHGIAWNDPDLNIPWPVTQPILSPKDKLNFLLKDIPHAELFA